MHYASNDVMPLPSENQTTPDTTPVITVKDFTMHTTRSKEKETHKRWNIEEIQKCADRNTNPTAINWQLHSYIATTQQNPTLPVVIITFVQSACKARRTHEHVWKVHWRTEAQQSQMTGIYAKTAEVKLIGCHLPSRPAYEIISTKHTHAASSQPTASRDSQDSGTAEAQSCS